MFNRLYRRLYCAIWAHEWTHKRGGMELICSMCGRVLPITQRDIKVH